MFKVLNISMMTKGMIKKSDIFNYFPFDPCNMIQVTSQNDTSPLRNTQRGCWFPRRIRISLFKEALEKGINGNKIAINKKNKNTKLAGLEKQHTQN